MNAFLWNGVCVVGCIALAVDIINSLRVQASATRITPYQHSPINKKPLYNWSLSLSPCSLSVPGQPPHLREHTSLTFAIDHPGSEPLIAKQWDMTTCSFGIFASHHFILTSTLRSFPPDPVGLTSSLMSLTGLMLLDSTDPVTPHRQCLPRVTYRETEVEVLKDPLHFY